MVTGQWHIIQFRDCLLCLYSSSLVTWYSNMLEFSNNSRDREIQKVSGNWKGLNKKEVYVDTTKGILVSCVIVLIKNDWECVNTQVYNKHLPFNIYHTSNMFSVPSVTLILFQNQNIIIQYIQCFCGTLELVSTLARLAAALSRETGIFVENF